VLKLPALAHQTEDNGFHEIQLNGKQLVFLFMAVTVVSVVIFLCGVLVGRGVRAERAATVAQGAGPTDVAPPDVVPSQGAAAAQPPAGSDPTAVAPPPSSEDLSYFNRLEKKGQPAEDLKPTEKAARSGGKRAIETAPPEKAAPPPAQAAPSEAAGKTAAEPADAVAADPGGAGFALQITALRERSEAESIAKRLSAKGYAAYVLTPAAGSPSVYRVRVGKFKTRREAQAIASKLQKEEQFTPWITR
jgi:cell division septation protein DedD